MKNVFPLNSKVASAIVVILVGGVTIGLVSLEKNQNSETSQEFSSDSPMSNIPDNKSVEMSNGNYKNGQYQATGKYQTPGGQESIDVQLTFSNGKVSAATLKVNADRGIAKDYQEDFAGSYKKSVVGKSVNDISLDTIAGSSLTPNGFNNALAQIKEKARA